ncbi:MAG: TolC family protein [Bacteroidota bacterium]
MKNNFFSLLLLMVAVFLFTLPQAWSQTMGPNDFWQKVKTNHPIARQAALLLEQGAQELLYARGGFDPKLYASQDQKVFDGKDYYRYGAGGVKIPTAWGLAFKAEYDWTDPNGLFFNPDRTVPEGGQAVAGIELPVLRGLFFDENRSNLRQAQLGQDRYRAIADELRNVLFMDANKAYWDWSYAYHSREIAVEARTYSYERLDGVKESFRAGDNPAIDTLEAFLQWQSWELEVQEANLQLNHAIAKIQALLWEQNGQPANWQDSWEPQHPEFLEQRPDLATLQQQVQEHPSLRAYRFQQQQLAIERRWKTEQFKPELTFNYNFLAERLNFNPAAEGGLRNLVNDNYKWGFTFSSPLFLRKERAGVALTDIKIAQTDWKQQQKQQELTTKLNAYWQEWENRSRQLVLANSVVDNYRALMDAERVKFRLGESSVFLLNSRQQKLLEAQLKQLKTQAELQKAVVALSYTAGVVW